MVSIPKEKSDQESVQLTLRLPEKYLVLLEGAEHKVLRPLNYRTGEPVKELDTDNPDEVSIWIRPKPLNRGEEFEVFKKWRRYDDIGQTEHGLSYRPQQVPTRPPELWKRAYFKSGVSGDDFYISCIPPISPGAIEAPSACAMHLMLGSTDINGREWGAYVRITFLVERLSDWEVIESRVVELLEPNLIVH